MSAEPSPFMSWHGLILSLRSDTEAERQYIEGILFALRRITDSPGKADITAEQVAELERLADSKVPKERPA